MKIKIRNSQDFYSGLFFVLFGLLAVVIARAYPMGTTVRMGPGYFPTLLGGALVLLGLIVAGRALWTRGDRIGYLALRPLLFVLGANLAFALMVRSLGLVLATFALVVTSCLGGWEFRLREVIALAFVLTGVAVALFVYGLGLPFNVWPQ